MALLGSFPQQVGEVMDYYISYVDWYSTRKDKPADFAAECEPGVEIIDFVIDSEAKLAKVTVDTINSQDNTESKITVWHTTTTGIIKEDDFIVRVRET